MSAAIPPKSSAREHQPGGQDYETINAILHNDSTAVRVTVGRRGVKGTPMTQSKADAVPKASKVRNWLRVNGLRQATQLDAVDQPLEFCKTSGRTPAKKQVGGPDTRHPNRPLRASQLVLLLIENRSWPAVPVVATREECSGSAFRSPLRCRLALRDPAATCRCLTRAAPPAPSE
jgi:hypothetical protein